MFLVFTVYGQGVGLWIPLAVHLRIRFVIFVVEDSTLDTVNEIPDIHVYDF